MVKIRRPYKDELEWFPNKEVKWVVENTGNKSFDLVSTFPIAIRYYLWHLGISPRIAFFSFKQLKRNKD